MNNIQSVLNENSPRLCFVHWDPVFFLSVNIGAFNSLVLSGYSSSKSRLWKKNAHFVGWEQNYVDILMIPLLKPYTFDSFARSHQFVLVYISDMINTE